MFAILFAAANNVIKALDMDFLFEGDDSEEVLRRVEHEKAQALAQGKPYCLSAEDYRKINGL